MSSSIVLIASSEALPALRERLASGAELHTFTDGEALEALDHIVKHKPRIVALDHEFSATSRGAALINRIKDDPSLTECEVRVIAHDTALNKTTVRRAVGLTPAVAVEDGDPKPALDQRGTRRAARVRVKEGVQVLVDGNTAMLVDVSTIGAQVVCTSVLKPNQRVRITFQEAKGIIRCNGSIAWAAFEMPKGQAPRYRAGIELAGANAESISAFAERNKDKSDK